MPNITSKSTSNKCGNDKCGTFAPAHLHPHHGGRPMEGSGGTVSGKKNMAHNQTAKGHKIVHHMHGGMAMPMTTGSMPDEMPAAGGGMDSDGDNDSGGY